jgi:hypothetical protein
MNQRVDWYPESQDVPDVYFACSKTGWNNDFLFRKWCEDVFEPETRGDGGKRLLLMDNLGTYLLSSRLVC